MKLEQENPNSKSFIHRYDENSVVINQETFNKSVLCGADIPPQIWPNATPDTFQVQHIQTLLEHCEHPPEVLLIGTGQQQVFPDTDIQRLLIQKKCPVEYMSTPAACRTFNILIGEGRKVVAGLLIENKQ